MCKIGVEQCDGLWDTVAVRNINKRSLYTVCLYRCHLSWEVWDWLSLTYPSSLQLTHQSEVTEMETECFGRENPSVTLATAEVGGVLSSEDTAQACQSRRLLEPLVVKWEDGEGINKKVSTDRRKKGIKTKCEHKRDWVKVFHSFIQLIANSDAPGVLMNALSVSHGKLYHSLFMGSCSVPFCHMLVNQSF